MSMSPKLIFNPNESEWTRRPIDLIVNRIFNPNESESIRTLIQSDWKSIHIRIDSDSFGLQIYFGFIRIEVSDWIWLRRINFQAFFNKRNSKRFSDWVELIRIASDTDIGIIRNSSDWLGMNSYPKFSPGII